MDKLNINIYTDGACSGNPGPGGWGALLLIKGKDVKEKFVLRGGDKDTTNNKMELLAVIEALEFTYNNITKDHNNYLVKVFSDSSYVVDTINNNWLGKWAINGWKTVKGTPVANKQLWEKLAVVSSHINAEMVKVKGHSGHKFNDFVDRVAVEESEKYKLIAKKF